MTEQAAQASLMALDAFESWLTASRQALDIWRTTIREIQDGMLASYRQQVVGAYAHDLLNEMKIPVRREALKKTEAAGTRITEPA
jgi:hypothetical protein